MSLNHIDHKSPITIKPLFYFLISSIILWYTFSSLISIIIYNYLGREIQKQYLLKVLNQVTPKIPKSINSYCTQSLAIHSSAPKRSNHLTPTYSSYITSGSRRFYQIIRALLFHWRLCSFCNILPFKRFSMS